MASIYGRADIYDLIESPERYAVYREHWRRVLEICPAETMLDVSIGTGSVTIPVLDLNVALSGSDLSGEMLGRCRRKIEEKGCRAELRKSDFRDLSCWEDARFGLTACTGNSIAYVSNEDVKKALDGLDRHTAEDGGICIDLRNWEKILRERKRFYLYDPFFAGDTRVNLVQVWDYPDDGSVIFNLLYTFERDDRIFQKETFEERYFPVSKDLIAGPLEKLGYRDVTVLPFPAQFPRKSFDETDWYTVVARKR